MIYRLVVHILLFACLALASGEVRAQVSLDGEEQAFLRMINDYRVANGLTPLVASPGLSSSARWMSIDMAQKNYFSHTDSLGRDPFTRMKAFGYTYNTWLGENLAAGYADAASTFNQFRGSPAHNDNMLNPNFQVIGIARATNSSSLYRTYWTTDFGGYNDDVSVTPVVTVATTVNAATYTAGIAPDSIAALFGSNLATGINAPASFPLPKSLGGTVVTVNGVPVDLLYVSPGQINFVVPSTTASGTATVEVSLNGTVVSRGTAAVTSVAPGIFTITADGKGIPTGYSTFDGKVLTPLALNGNPRPVDPGTVQRPDYLVMFGTGIRKRSVLSSVQVFIGGIQANVDYAGAQGTFAGLDQLQVIIPTTARGSGTVNVVVLVDGKQANNVSVNIGN